jgi:flavin reductase (DIM6/NTAB) family NADH-FMN oxidoreductase RutF
MFHYEPKNLSVPDLHKLLLGGVGPRPIALVSTISVTGINNLSPFSFFNVFGANPAILAFSPSRRGRDASLKDTYNNLIQTMECVVQAVTYSMAEQVNLASTEYPPGIDEFGKSGLTPLNSDIVKPKRVKESPFQLECKLVEMKSYGEGGAAANIAICQVLKLHIAEDIFTDGIIDPGKIDLIGRMSGNYYCRANGDAIFEIVKPVGKKSIGYDKLPDYVKNSEFFTANEIAKLANVEYIPDEEQANQFISEFKKNEFSNFEFGEEAFYRYQRQFNYKFMLLAALQLSDEKHTQINKIFEKTVRSILKNNETEIAWNVIIYSHKMISTQD